jgi:hypothetical protein
MINSDNFLESSCTAAWLSLANAPKCPMPDAQCLFYMIMRYNISLQSLNFTKEETFPNFSCLKTPSYE